MAGMANAGCPDEIIVRADSGYYPGTVVVCRRAGVRFSVNAANGPSTALPPG